jgi:hypothetical protein
VRVFDISKFFNAREENGELAVMAGWREFKYRHHEMYTVHRPFTYRQPTYNSLEEQKAMDLPFSTQNRTHPAPSPLLSSFHQCRDVPIGAILHVLHVCKRIKRLNISRLHLASDYIILSPAVHRPASKHIKNPDPFICIPEQSKACTTFVSDAPKSWRFTQQDLIPVYADDIIKLICRLPELEILTARHSKWLNLKRVRTLLRDAQREGIDRKGRLVKGLLSVDLRYSGMWTRLGWSIKGRREIVEKLVNEMEETHEQTIS